MKCAECNGSGVAEVIGGWPIDCVACRGEGVAPADRSGEAGQTAKQAGPEGRERGDAEGGRRPTLVAPPTEHLRKALEPCPFCGGYAEPEHLESGRWSIGCGDENCAGYLLLTTFARRAEAAKAWNTRAALSPASTPDGAGEDERRLIVGWLRDQANEGASYGIEAEKGSTRRAAFGGGSLALDRAADAIEAGDHLSEGVKLPLYRREQGPPCENCSRPIEVGQVVLPYEDVELHADCEHPYSLKVERSEDGPEPVVLLGEPMLNYPLPTACLSPPVDVEGLVEAADALELVAGALREVHTLGREATDDGFDAHMFGQIAACERGASLLRKAALHQPALQAANMLATPPGEMLQRVESYVFGLERRLAAERPSEVTVALHALDPAPRQPALLEGGGARCRAKAYREWQAAPLNLGADPGHHQLLEAAFKGGWDARNKLIQRLIADANEEMHRAEEAEAQVATLSQPPGLGKALDPSLYQKAKGALAFAASRNALTAAEEKAILAALSPTPDSEGAGK